MEYALTGRWLSAERAYELNLVNRLTDPGEALGAALDLADEIAGHAPLAVQATTAAIRDAGYHDSQEAAWASQRQRLQHVARSQDSREGIAAFLDKRAPQWRGG
jgi:enoyl-CoA hydratase